MPSPISDFLQNYLAIAQFREGVRQHRVEEATSRSQQLMGFVNLARNTTDPKLQEGLVNTFEQLGVADRGTLQQLLAYTSPTAEVVQGQALQQGIGALQGTPLQGTLNRETAFRMLTGASSGEALQGQFLGSLFEGANQQLDPATKSMLTQGLMTRTATGMDPGAFAMSRTLGGLPQSELTAGAGIQLGTRMNAAQSAANALNVRQQGFQEWMGRQDLGLRQGQLELGWAGNQLGGRQLEAETAYQMGQLQLGAAHATGAGGVSANSIPDLISTQRQLMADLQKNASNMSSSQIKGYLTAIDNTGQALQRAGISAIRIKDPTDVSQVFRGTWFNQARAWFDAPH